MIVRPILIVVALAVAVAFGLAFLPLAVLVDPVTRAAAFAFSVDRILAFLAAAFSWPDRAPDAIVVAAWTLAVTVCVVPILVVALIGELAGAACLLWYVGATGLLAAGLPWIVRARHLGRAGARVVGGEVEARLALVFFLTGVLSGFIYWLIAGRGAARASPRH